MKQRRLTVLLLVMCLLGIGRVFLPANERGSAPVVAEAIVRKPKVAPSPVKQQAPELALASPQGFASLHDDTEVAGNAFAVRPPPKPPAPPKAAATPVAVAKTNPPLPAVMPTVQPSEPPPPVMPYQVIGTWDDGKSPGVFLSGPSGTLLARAGMTLPSEYVVSSITPQQISLMHLASKREVRLAISRPPLTPPAVR